MASTKKINLHINAITSEFQTSMNEARASISLLNSQLKLNKSELKGDATNVDLLKERVNLLNEKVEEEHTLTESLQKSLEKATEIYGEDSEEVEKLTKDLNNQKSVEQNVRNELQQVNTQLEEQIEAQEDNRGATEKLRDAIEEQSDELENLKEQYTDVILEQGEESDEAQELKSKMEDLNSELKENKTKLNDAESSSDDFTDALDDLDDNVDETSDGFTVFKGALADLVSNGIQTAISAIGDLASEVVDLGSDFTSSMSKVEALSGATEEEMELIEETARELGSSTKYSASEVADAFQYMALAGWDTNEMTESMASVLNLATAADMDLADASDIVTDYLTAFGLTSENSTEFVDQLTYAMANSNTTVDQLGEAYKNVATTSTQLGYSLEDTTSALMVMANSGIKGGEAGTALASIMTRLGNNTSGCADILSQYGIEVYDAEGNTNSLSSVLSGMQSVWSSLTDEEKSNLAYTVAGKTAQSELMTILGDSSGSFETYANGLNDCTGSAEEMAETMQDNLSGDVTEMNSAFEELGLQIFDGLEEPLRGATQFITDTVIPALSWLIDNMPTVATVFAGVTAAIIAQKIATGQLNVVQTVQQTITGLVTAAQTALNLVMSLNPISLVILAITALIAVFVTLWNNCEGFREAVTGIWDTIKSVFTKITSFVSEKVGAIKDTLVSFGQKAGDAISGAIKGAINWVLEKVENVLNVPINAINGLLSVINKVPGVNISKLSTFSLPRLKSGMSYVPSDYYPAYLDEGERVLTKEENEVYNRVGGMIGLLNSQVDSQINGNNSFNANAILDYLDIIAKKDNSLYIDSQELAKATGTANDEVNGEIVALKERGLEI